MHDPKHQGETRDTRLQEFCAFNPHTPCLALYEGQALRVTGEQTQILTVLCQKVCRDCHEDWPHINRLMWTACLPI